MKSFFAIAALSISVLACGLSGCGTPGVSASAEATLKGNWLLTGSVPTSFSLPLPSTLSALNLTMTIDVVGDQVIASSSFFYACPSIAFGGSGNFTTGTIARDGSFTLESQRDDGMAPTLLISVKGNVPRNVNDGWTGSYSATSGNTNCKPLSGTFTAQPIQQVNGSFSGSTFIEPTNGSTSIPITITANLKQGGPASLDGPPIPRLTNSENAISGTIAITGLPCFTNGTAVIPSGIVDGDTIEAFFTMDDGSRMLLLGNAKDLAVSGILLRSLLIVGGKCDGYFSYAEANLMHP